ncbi:HAMP domain-containing sensor histidine kinase [Paenibacillus sp. FSL R10-2734]|uniref:HAMP domain-containing sensor histidine kinase n=1 Tax=Paenibacillus sp. FSL R10-2734 TaxID=2954691 RepID=UPI0030D83EC1
MKLPIPKIAATLLLFLLLTAIVPYGAALVSAGSSDSALPSWEIRFGSAEAETVEEAVAASEDEWIRVTPRDNKPETPRGTSAAWLRFSLPQISEKSALFIDEIYGNNIKAYLNNALVYDSENKYNFNGSKILIPLSKEDGGQQLYIWTQGGSKDLGIEGEIRVDRYSELLPIYAKQGLIDIIIGMTLIFIAIVLLICSLFLKKGFFTDGFLLVLILLSIGIIVVTYSSFLSIILGNYGKTVLIFFDLALYTLLPSLTFYFEKIFGPGKKQIVNRFRKFQMVYSIFCLSLMVINILLSYQLEDFYRFMTTNVLGIIMIVQFILLVSLAFIHTYRGNADAVVFTTGFSTFAFISLGELVMYYISGESYRLYWWKWGMMVFVLSLIVILGRRFTRNHEQLVEYSRKLETFNNELQRSEKMEIISELAASVAHEVRNPLQVTRGFLQILGERSDHKDREYMKMAIAELDRATVIISDFLTFAKPGLETIERLDVSEELRHVSGILSPLANLQGGVIELNLQSGLCVIGSSAKFKQAFINIIKNSIEALQENGLIRVTAWQSQAHIMISVRDNGEGMDGSELARLGEPYYSNKIKGTGLGLMVTFRIIEAMEGTTEFQSEKGEGTEFIVKLPKV